MNKSALMNIGYGLYVLTTNYDNKDNGCIINTVMQVADNPCRIAISVNKHNYTSELISNSCVFNISMLTVETPFKVFEHFGYQSGRNIDKFAECTEEHRSANHVLYLPKYTNAYCSARVVSSIDLGTHILFIAEVTEAEVLSEIESVTYSYYQQNIKPKPESTTKKGWRCKICGWIYEGDELPEDIICPICKHGAADFERIG